MARTDRAAKDERENTMYQRLIGAAALGTALLAGTAGVSHAASSSATPGKRAGIIQQVAAVEGVTPQVLRQDLKQGQTLLQIAGSKYSDANALATALLAPARARLDKAVSAKRMNAVQENLLYTSMLVRTTVLVVTPHPVAALVRLHGAPARNGAPIMKAAAAACNTTPKEFRAAVKAGDASVLAICQRTNPAETQDGLTAAIYAPIKGKLAAGMESQIGTIIQQEIGAAITYTGTASPAGA
jgi:hypothetical protein